MKRHRCKCYGSCTECGRVGRGLFVYVLHARMHQFNDVWIDFDCDHCWDVVIAKVAR